MKKTLFASALVILLAGCKSEDTDSGETDLNAATNFIQAALKGDFKTAEKYMVDDSLNHETLDAIGHRLDERLSKEEKEAYRSASIRIHNNHKLNDSTTIISYSNSYRNKVDSLKVVRLDGKWLVDFKYIFNQHPDTLQ